jgi:ribonucleoside-diphosphate reductase alpha chain
MSEAGIPVEDVIGSANTTAVFSFPIKAPEGCITRHDMTAIEHLEIWKLYAEHWCEHKPSITVSLKEDEWVKVSDFVFDNINIISGISFLPMDDHIYDQPPYEDCSKKEYQKLLKQMPKSIDWKKLGEYELEDNTRGSQTLNCTGDFCEIVDLV